MLLAFPLSEFSSCFLQQVKLNPTEGEASQVRNINSMDDNDGSSPDSSPNREPQYTPNPPPVPNREPQYTPNPPPVPVTAPYYKDLFFGTVHYCANLSD
jgi:hypothetical protein